MIIDSQIVNLIPISRGSGLEVPDMAMPTIDLVLPFVPGAAGGTTQDLRGRIGSFFSVVGQLMPPSTALTTKDVFIFGKGIYQVDVHVGFETDFSAAITTFPGSAGIYIGDSTSPSTPGTSIADFGALANAHVYRDYSLTLNFPKAGYTLSLYCSPTGVAQNMAMQVNAYAKMLL